MPKIKDIKIREYTFRISFDLKTEKFSVKLPMELLQFSGKSSSDFSGKSVSEIELMLSALVREYNESNATYEEVILISKKGISWDHEQKKKTFGSTGGYLELYFGVFLKNVRGGNVSYMKRLKDANAHGGRWSLGHNLSLPEDHVSWKYESEHTYDLNMSSVIELPYAPELEESLLSITSAIQSGRDKLAQMLSGDQDQVILAITRPSLLISSPDQQNP